MKKRLLLLSNSTNPGEPYLGWPASHINDFLGDKVKKVLFIPYAGVTISFDDYFEVVSEQFQKWGYEMESIHSLNISPDLISKYDAITIGGGNTFQLTYLLQKNRLIEQIQTAVNDGLPYIGWSAGSNITCPTIKTTNDMPIVEPDSFNALNLIPFQINPHYTEAIIPNHGGESRDTRIKEFLIVNPEIPVAGLPEGSLLRLEKGKLYFIGKGTCKLFKLDHETASYKDGDDLSWLITTFKDLL
jgi:dipeptidase E